MPLSKEEFVAKHRHELAGMVIDAAVSKREGGELSLWMQVMLNRIDAKLAASYDALVPPAPLPVVQETNNGPAKTIPKGVNPKLPPVGTPPKMH